MLVLGMHRSGTSALARTVAQLGAVPPRFPNPPAADNPEGYWEPAEIVRLHDRMLAAMGSAWLDLRPPELDRISAADRAAFAAEMRAALAMNFGQAQCFVLKDPRLCRLMPFWRALLDGMGTRVKVVIALRHPAEVAASLQVRNQLSPGYAGLLWARHMLEVERQTRDLPRLVLCYDALLADWRAVARQLLAFLRTELPVVALDAGEAPVRAALRHHGPANGPAFPDPLARLLPELHDLLAARPPGQDPAHFDALAVELAAAEALAGDALEAEFRHHRLTSPYALARAPDPLAERHALAAALGRLQEAAWAGRPDR